MKEKLILNHLITNPDFRIKVLPYLQEEYFKGKEYQIVFKVIRDYIEKYYLAPSKEALVISLKPHLTGLTEAGFKKLDDIIENELFKDDTQDFKWLLDTTESFCQDQALYIALSKGIEIYQGINTELTKAAIPDLIREATQISFEASIGHDYTSDIEDRFDFYTQKESGIPFDLTMFNVITNGIGLPRKSLIILLAGTNVGKTLMKCHMAANALRQGFNVLYITLEMASMRIAQRIDANLIDVPFNDLPDISRVDFDRKIKQMQKTCKGKLFIKEYPTSIGNALHFERDIQELYNKKGVKIDLLVVDYIGICSSYRFSQSKYANTYVIGKGVAEEIRALAMKYDIAVLSSAQVRRDDMDKKEVGTDSISESIGISFTADAIWAAYRDEYLDKMGRIHVTQLKSRFVDITKNKKFVVGVNKEYMRLFDANVGDLEVYENRGSNQQQEDDDDTHNGPIKVNQDHFRVDARENDPYNRLKW